MQMHHTAVQLRNLMPQANYLTHLSQIMGDMEAAAKNGTNTHYVEDGTYGVDDMDAWRKGNKTCRTARIVTELERLGYSVSYREITPETGLVTVLVISW